MNTKIMFIFFILLTGFFVFLPFIKDIPDAQIIALRLWQVLTFSGMLIFVGIGRIIDKSR